MKDALDFSLAGVGFFSVLRPDGEKGAIPTGPVRYRKKMRPFLAVLVALLLPSSCFADAGVAASPHAVVAGEVDNPGRFELTKAATLSAIFIEVTKPLAWGHTGRIRVYRNGTRRDYDLKKFGDVTVSDGDVVEVPIKSVYEGQGEVQDQVFKVFTEDAKEFMGQVAILKSDLWKARSNWREGIEGIEFRPTGEIRVHGGVSVFVRVATPAELAAVRDQKGSTATIDSHAVIVIARDPGRGAKPSEFESTLVTQIQAIPSHQNKAAPSNGDMPSN